jgi:hypothetical protein
MITACETCGGPFQSRRRWSRYCSATCRVAAHRARASVTHSEPQGAGAQAPKSSPGTSTPRCSDEPAAAAVTSVTQDNPAVGIVPDECWPGVYHIRFRDGRLSDMVNLTRAKDALASLNAPRRR